MLEVAQPWEPRFAPQETVLETVRCLSSRKPTRLKYKAVGQRQHCPRVLLNGAHADAMSGGIQDVVIIQCATKGEAEHVGG